MFTSCYRGVFFQRTHIKTSTPTPVSHKHSCWVITDHMFSCGLVDRLDVDEATNTANTGGYAAKFLGVEHSTRLSQEQGIRAPT